jgi:hypothetical protein
VVHDALHAADVVRPASGGQELEHAPADGIGPCDAEQPLRRRIAIRDSSVEVGRHDGVVDVLQYRPVEPPVVRCHVRLQCLTHSDRRTSDRP